ncbi:flagellar protein FlgN [Maritimibacter sp. 55A14]|uniref:flagellar protein FlgN n=1 Tax=Maritimibacter sp. 55A14 TaxID=2174844 RepID=UPI000D614046|nr:flagellar protein FlgN [Maritimibacter sp. 55A14]PWE32372.1 flagellar protein FlgN [Maritimibacter sp. 55A14]
MRRDDMDALHTLLETERRCLLDGDLNAVAVIIPEKQRLVTALESSDIRDRGRWHALQRAAQWNQTLLEGAMSGVRMAGNRLAALRRNLNQLDTYDTGGRRRSLGADRPSVERKA